MFYRSADCCFPSPPASLRFRKLTSQTSPIEPAFRQKTKRERVPSSACNGRLRRQGNAASLRRCPELNPEKERLMRRLRLIALNIFVTVLLVFVVDQLLGLFGFPADTPFQSAHGKNRWDFRTNIEYQHEFMTNDFGLRYGELPREKPAGEARFLLVGDSFTEGQGVEAEETFGAFLEEHYRGEFDKKIRFINAGLSGQGPAKYWRVFHEVGLTLDLDGVLICMYGNDVTDTPASLTREDLYRRYPERQGLDGVLHRLVPRLHALGSKAVRKVNKKLRKRRGFRDVVSARAREVGISEEAIQRWNEALPADLVAATNRNAFNGTLLSHGLLGPDIWVRALDLDGPGADRQYQAVELVLDEILQVARERGIAVGLVYIPGPMQYDPSRHESWNPMLIGGVQFREAWLHRDAGVQKRLASWATAKKVPFLDLTATFRAEIKQGRALNFRLDGHWNPEGHQVAGRAIAAWLDRGEVFRELEKPGADG